VSEHNEKKYITRQNNQKRKEKITEIKNVRQYSLLQMWSMKIPLFFPHDTLLQFT
jgi:hypothetical protein